MILARSQIEEKKLKTRKFFGFKKRGEGKASKERPERAQRERERERGERRERERENGWWDTLVRHDRAIRRAVLGNCGGAVHMHMHVYQNEGADAAEHERRVREGYLAFPHAFWSRLPWKERDKKKRMLKPERLRSPRLPRLTHAILFSFLRLFFFCFAGFEAFFGKQLESERG